MGWVTGHIISRQKGGRADLYLRVNNAIKDYSLSEDSTNQWIDQNVNNAMTLKKGKYTFSLTGNKNSRFGCGAGWGDLDIVVVPKLKGVAAYNQPDTKSGCPAKRAANTDLILRTITVAQPSIIKVTGHIIRTFSGRADAYLKYQRKSTLDTSLSYTNNKRWEDVKLHYVAKLGKGTHTFSIWSNRANAFGCGTAWGDIDILVLPQTMAGEGQPVSTKSKTVVAYQTPDSRSGCPRSQGANSALITKKVTVSEDSYIVATGHMIRLYKGRADLYLNLNNKRVDYSLTYTPSRQWKDTQVYWVGSIKKGSHTFTVTGSRANAFGCGSTWGDLDIMVIPKLAGVAVYQFGIPSSCPSVNLKFSKTITLPQDSVVYATGHIITNQKGGRADLYLSLNNGIRDYALSEDSTGQWVDLTVNNAVTLKKGKYTYSLTSSKNSRFGCGASWGDLDLVVVPRFKGVAAYNDPDRKSGCPAKRAANSDLILKTIKVDQTSVIKVTGHIIRTFNGRADAYLKYQRKTTLDTSLTYTNNKIWEDVKLHFTGTFGKGTHTFSIRSNKANAFGCGTAWGDIDILVLPQKMSG